MSSSQSKKTRFRNTSPWKKFRKQLKEERKVDEITLRPLYNGYQCHHKDLDEKHYTDLRDKNKFSVLNKQTHDNIHWLYRYYRKDPAILDRIKKLLDDMVELEQKNN